MLLGSDFIFLPYYMLPQCFLMTLLSVLLVGLSALGFLACNSDKHVNKNHSAAEANTIPDTGYAVYQVLKVHAAVPGKSLTICLLQDNRLRGLISDIHYYRNLHAAAIFFSSDMAMFDPDPPGYKPAVLVIKNDLGVPIYRNTLDVPTARIDTLYANERSHRIAYLLTKDYSTGMGSYNGPITYLIYFTDTGIVSYKGDNHFMNSLKTSWLVRYDSAGEMQICSKACRPSEKVEFAITMRKCLLVADSIWTATTVMPGFWENESNGNEGEVQSFLEEFNALN